MSSARVLNPPKLAKHNDGDGELDPDERDGAEEQLEAIENIQRELDALNDRASEEILRVEQKYNGLRKPHFAQRTEAISKVPEFWFTALLNQPVVVERVTERDEEALRYLSNIEVQEFEDIKSGYRISFEFQPNPYFDNDRIVKEFILVNDSGDPTSTSTPIRWKDSMDLTVSPVPVKGQKRLHDAGKSFFTWFNETQEDGADEIGEAIKDELWTNPLPFYLSDNVLPEEGDEQYDDEVESGEEGDKQEIVVVEDDDDEVYDEDDGGQSGRDPPAEFEEEEGDEPDVLEGEEFEGEEEAEGDEELLHEQRDGANGVGEW